MKKNFHEVANNISEDSKSWMQQFEYSAPAEIKRRRDDARTIKDLARTVFGLFVKPQFKNFETLYVFEGFRNKEYMSVFTPQSVLVIGSHQEKAFAEAHGYGFCWSFPMVSATHAKMYKDWDIPIVRQIKCWIKKLSLFKQVIFFLYEDTQPLGVFLVHLGRILKPKVTSICIQHGYFGITHFELRNDGQLSDINFVWDTVQAGLTGSDKNKTFEIGLPYAATAASTGEMIVILVGTGMSGDGNHDYEKSLDIFFQIYHDLSQSSNIKIFYRPHPNEWTNKELISKLHEKFSLLDELDKVERLNGPKAVFIGTISSLLYEAGLSGHLVAHLELCDTTTPVFNYDIKFGLTDIDNLVAWILKNWTDHCLNTHHPILNQNDSLNRFVSALHFAKLIDVNNVKEF